MITVMKCLRAWRSVCRTSEIPAKVVCSAEAVQQREHHTPNLQRLCVARPRRSFSTGANTDSNTDPLSQFDEIYPLNTIQFEQLSGGDPKEERRIRLLQMELAVRAVQYPATMPRRISYEHWKQLLTLSHNSQLKYLSTILKKEKQVNLKKTVRHRKEDDEEDFEYDMVDFQTNVFEHKLFRNSLVPMIHPNTVGAALNSRLLDAYLFNPTLVMDFGYESVMTVREVKNLCQQMGVCVNANKYARKPFKMVFCNLKKDSLMGQTLWSAIPNIYDPHVPIETSENCYTDMFPRDRIVYLTPHCREPLEYDPHDIYIIGAMVDKSNPGPHSLIKAKAQKLRMASFPLDKYLVWKQGTKSLTLNQVVSVLVKYSHTRDWSEALKVVPRRKIIDVPNPNFLKRGKGAFASKYDLFAQDC